MWNITQTCHITGQYFFVFVVYIYSDTEWKSTLQDENTSVTENVDMNISYSSTFYILHWITGQQCIRQSLPYDIPTFSTPIRRYIHQI